MRTILNLITVLLLAVVCPGQDNVPDYRNPKLPIPDRVADLVKRMTLEEKVDQLAGGRRRMMTLPDPEAQKYLVEKTRLGIPAISQGEALHGYMAHGSSSFPQVLGLASTWDPDLVQRVFTAAADEMASAGTNQAFTPVLDLARDPGDEPKRLTEKIHIWSRAWLSRQSMVCREHRGTLIAVITWSRPPSTSQCTANLKEAPIPRRGIIPSE